MNENARNVLIICVTVMFCFVVGTAVAIVRLTTDNNAALGLVTILFTNLGIVIAALAALIKSNSAQNTAQDVNDTVTSIESHTNRILNGEMERKVEEAVANVLTNWLTKEETRPHPKSRT